jgi:hypothetical protein
VRSYDGLVVYCQTETIQRVLSTDHQSVGFAMTMSRLRVGTYLPFIIPIFAVGRIALFGLSIDPVSFVLRPMF